MYFHALFLFFLRDLRFVICDLSTGYLYFFFAICDLSTVCMSFSSWAFFHGIYSWVYLHGLIFTDLHSRVIIFFGGCLHFLFDGFSLPAVCVIFLTCLSIRFTPIPLDSCVLLILVFLNVACLLDPRHVMPVGCLFIGFLL